MLCPDYWWALGLVRVERYIYGRRLKMQSEDFIISDFVETLNDKDRVIRELRRENAILHN